MAWNEPGNGKNPWDRGQGQGPPDLDKIIRAWQQRLVAFLRGGRSSRGGSGGQSVGQPGGAAVVALAGLVLAVWVATGFYRVDDAERGVVTRFGKYQESTMPGLRWHLPWPIERVERVNTNEIVPFKQQTRMLTADENIVVVDLVVQYRKADPVKYLFNVRDPEATLQDVSESAIREVIGKNKLDFVLLEGRTEIAVLTERLVQQTLDEYQTGMLVTKVNLQDANFPSQVETAVQDAIKAREDRERLSFEAEAYANDVVPRARGEAVRRQQEAEGYRARVVADAQGEAARFELLLAEYKKAPEVTRRRLYLEAMEEIYGASNKVLIDADGGNNLLYLPVDKILEQRRSNSVTPAPRPAVPAAAVDAAAAGVPRDRADLRTRGAR
ncbi:MAG: FtsH protease activity modulator HflK [Gammaproteobacteria bacterium]|jgi:membrane protease subunit HflK|nr:FtsH protease activity modulator HflK [Gammaproteobacteria bacterium]